MFGKCRSRQSICARRFGVGQWSFIGPGSGYSSENSPQGALDNIAEEMLLEFAESGHPTFRATTSLSRSQLKSKGHFGKIKAKVLLQNGNSKSHQILWQQYIERIASFSPESKVSGLCQEAGFMRVVEVGQYFVTKDFGNSRQFRSVASLSSFTSQRMDSRRHENLFCIGSLNQFSTFQICN